MSELEGMRCPKCGSEDWRVVPWVYLLFAGLGITSCGLWLILIVIGIPIVLLGLLISVVAPVVGTRYVCKRCNTSWKPSRKA